MIEKKWEAFLQERESALGKQVVDTWLRTLTIQDFDAHNLYLEAASDFQVLWFEEHIRPLLKMNLRDLNDKPILVHLSSPGGSRKAERKSKEIKKPPLQFQSDPLISEHTFENYAPPEDALFPSKLLEEVAKGNEKAFNPIYLYGREGSGKTHLMMATAIKSIAEEKNARFVHAQTFTDHVVEAIRSSQMAELRKIYRSVDLLLIDDIHLLANRFATQEEFFHTFNTLHMEGKQIILSAPLPPSELKGIEARLTSRFEWGLCVEVKAASRAEVREIAMRRARDLKLDLEEKALDFLLLNFSNKIASVDKALHALALREVKNSAFSIDQIKILLKDLLETEKKVALIPETIFRAVAEVYGIRKEDILSKSQTQECAIPRQVAMYFCREKLEMPYKKIGALFSRDHSTVMSSIKRIQKDSDQFGEVIKNVERKLTL